jgi:hypothetical protein
VDVALVDAVMPPLLAAIGAVGRKVLTVAEDATADATVRLGQRLLARLRGTRLDEAVTDVADRPGDDDFNHALRAQVKKALAEGGPLLADDLRELLATAGVRVSAAGAGSVAVQHNEGIVSTGDGAANTVNRG